MESGSGRSRSALAHRILRNRTWYFGNLFWLPIAQPPYAASNLVKLIETLPIPPRQYNMLTRACALVVRAGIRSLPDSGYEESVFPSRHHGAQSGAFFLPTTRPYAICSAINLR